MTMMHGLVKRLCRSESGAAMVEFAFVLPVLLSLILGVMEIGRALYAYQTLDHAVREGARFAIVRGSESANTASAQDIQDRVEASAVLDASDLTVSVSFQPDNNPGSVVTIQASYDFEFLFFKFPTDPIILDRSASMVIMQ